MNQPNTVWLFRERAGYEEFYLTGEHFIEWDLRELEIPPAGEHQHYRHRLQASGVPHEN